MTAAPRATTNTQTPLDIARAYIAAGIPVFPAREKSGDEFDPSTGEIVERMEKSPLTTNGLKGATRTGRIIDIWFGERYPSALIGLPTGEPLGAWVLDLDRHGDRDGHEWLAAMEKKHGALPKTARAKTANGGTHIFFKHEEGIRNRAAVAPGVDSRGEGGYICGPGSVMADGRRYEWLEWDPADGLPEFAPAPEWLVDMFKTREAPPTTASYTGSVSAAGGNPVYVERAVDKELMKLASTPQGGRNQALNESAFTLGRLVGGGHLSESEALNGLESVARQWPSFAKSLDTIKRGLKDGMAQPRDVPAPDNDNTPPINPALVKKMLERGREKEAQKAAAKEAPATAASQPPTADPTPANMDAPPTKREKLRFDLTWFDEIEEGKPKETILKGWLGVGEFTTISGLPGTGKSVITTDLACHIAAGMEWHGLPVKQGLVIYVAAERKKLTERRMLAFRKHHDVHDVPLLVVGGQLNFTRDEKDAELIIGIIREAETITGQQCVWIIIDTLTRVFGQGDQNASKDMVSFVNSCNRILVETGAHITAIHHAGWSGDRGKGAIDLDGAVDASFMVKKDGSRHKLVCDGTNDGEEGEVIAFTMEPITIGHGEDGEPTIAPVVVKVGDGPKLKTSSEATKGHNKRALEILTEMSGRVGVDPESPGYPDGALVVSHDDWRQAVYADAGDKIAAAALNKRYNRAKKDLLDDGLIGENATWVWVVPQSVVK